MIKKILKSLLTNKQSHRRSYSSSDFKRRKYTNHHPSKYGHQHYKKKHKSSGFFSSYSS
ncbi:hypothetical protein JOC75_000095 [Metabacillus crassostreae]|uniref:hypothetical protein n=1 Tax=Metabacillus crassostreae TaxID=929098 RepID=UPI00195E1CA5|nr:hypothetical protein [Metabacillus crassostreae]MBM7602125.1 hypothetical protein [Metabacillus crassostreae]